MWLINEQQPHYKTIANFRKDNAKAFKEVFRYFVAMLKDWKLIDGKTIAIAYQDNGRFFVNVMKTDGEELDHFDVSAHLVIDEQSTPITGFWEPLITSVFIPVEDGQDLFIVAYQRTQQKQYNFTYSYRHKKVLSSTTVHEIQENCT